MTDIFVFGSNLAGRHGAGSALEAVRRYGAIRGIGIGLQGQSYAIPTKDANLDVLPLEAIAYHVQYFEYFALAHSQLSFDVVAIGCGLAAYTPRLIGPLFQLRPINVRLPPEFQWSALR
jgi:hypothetical protein